MTPELSALARWSGAFAMLAVDQREGLRVMLARHQPGPLPDLEQALRDDAVPRLPRVCDVVDRAVQR